MQRRDVTSGYVISQHVDVDYYRWHCYFALIHPLRSLTGSNWLDAKGYINVEDVDYDEVDLIVLVMRDLVRFGIATVYNYLSIFSLITYIRAI